MLFVLVTCCEQHENVAHPDTRISSFPLKNHLRRLHWCLCVLMLSVFLHTTSLSLLNIFSNETDVFPIFFLCARKKSSFIENKKKKNNKKLRSARDEKLRRKKYKVTKTIKIYSK